MLSSVMSEKNKSGLILNIIKLKAHVKTECESHDLNMDFYYHLTMASNSFVLPILCKDM